MRLRRSKAQTAPVESKEKMGTMNRILIILGAVLGAYTVAVLVIYWHTGGEPSTLTACIFGLCTAEGGFMSLIQTTKVKNPDPAPDPTPEPTPEPGTASRAGKIPDDGTLL